MRKIVMFLFAIICCMTIVSCSKKMPQDGFVEFSVEGREYRIDGRRFMIRANPLFGEGEKFKVISKGVKTLFEFSIGPTSARAEKELESLGKDLKKGASGDFSSDELGAINTFDAIWVTETTEPEEILESKITLEDTKLGLKNFAINMNIPDRHISNPPREMHNCWIKFDEFTSDRVKGRFGGGFIIYLRGKEVDEKIQQGLINVNELEAEIEINDGVFDMPYKKCFKYR